VVVAAQPFEVGYVSEWVKRGFFGSYSSYCVSLFSLVILQPDTKGIALYNIT